MLKILFKIEKMEQKLDEYIYDGKFEGNVLIVGRTGCGKTTLFKN